MIKTANVAGKFYTANREELLEQFRSFDTKPEYECTSRAIIVPHAGYMYSGWLAYQGFLHLDKNVKNIFIFAPSHFVPLEKACVLSSADSWETPLGNISLNKEIQEEMVQELGLHYMDEAFEREHALEVQVPFIQHFYDVENVKIIPILTNYDFESVERIIEKYYGNWDNGFVISSDLSHFHADAEAKKIDNMTAQMIETKNIENFSTDQACGGVSICALVDYAKKRDFSLIRIGLTNSGETSGELRQVVGYGSWLLYEGERNDFIKKYFSDLLLDMARKSIEGKDILHIPAVLQEDGASFVTLEIEGVLRGCMGSILPDGPLYKNIMKNARQSAFNDPRFYPLTREEFNRIDIAISLLSIPSKMNFKDEADLLEQIMPDEDGIIINDKGRQAVYLPCVWECLPEKCDFLNSLKQKAELPAHHFSETFEAYRFSAAYIKN